MWSGLHQKADFGGSTGDVAEVPVPDSCSAANCRLIDQLVGVDQQGGRNGKPERLGGLHVDVQLDFRGLLDWQICGLFAFENAAGVGA